MPRSEFSQTVIELIRQIPEGKVCTYGSIAELAGNPRAARQVVRVLYSCGRKENLPWYRVINREGRIAIKQASGKERQQELLEHEGVVFDWSGKIDLDEYMWRPGDTI